MTPPRELNIRVAVQDEASAAFDRLQKRMDALRRQSERPASGPGFLEGLSGDARSAAGGLGSARAFKTLLRGGLVGFGGNALGNVAESAVELKNALASGEKSATEIVQKFAEGLPLIGGFARAGRNIHEFFTGQQAALAKALAEQAAQLKLVNDHTKFQAELAEQVKSHWQGVAAAIEAAKDRRELAGLDGFERDATGQQQGADARRRAIDADRNKALAEVEKTARERVEQIQKDASEKNLSRADVRAALTKASNERLKARSEIIAGSTKQAFQEELASEAEREAMGQQARQRAEDAVRAHEEEVRRIKHDSHVAALREQHRGFDAEIAQIDEQSRQRIDAIRQRAEKEAKAAAPEDRQRIKDAAQQQIDAINEATIESRGRAYRAAQREAQKLMIDQLEMLGLWNSKWAKTSPRAPGASPGPAVARAEGIGLTTGVRESAQARGMDPVTKATQENLKVNTKAEQHLAKIVAALTGGETV